MHCADICAGANQFCFRSLRHLRMGILADFRQFQRISTFMIDREYGFAKPVYG